MRALREHPAWIRLLTAMLLAGPAPALAVYDGCLVPKLKDMLGLNPELLRVVDFSQYEHSQAVLLLSDGHDPRHFQLGRAIANRFPQKRVVSTDIGYDSRQVTGNHVRQPMDNTRPFPFADNSFDTVVLRGGLCDCKARGVRTCAGFCTIGTEAWRFFSEVARVLDKSNPRSVAVLHGLIGDPGSIEEWKRILARVEQVYGVQALFHYTDGGLLGSVTLRPPQR